MIKDMASPLLTPAKMVPPPVKAPPSAKVIPATVQAPAPARAIITCDASSLAGLPSGRYSQWDAELEVLPGGKVVVPDTPYLAGSGAFTDVCVGNAVRMAGIGLGDAIDMAGARPRDLLGLPAWDLAVGSTAPLLLFDWEPGGDVVVQGVIGGRP